MTSSTQTPPATDALLPLLDWLATESPKPSPRALANMLRLGITDLVDAGNRIGGDATFNFEADALREALAGTPWPGDPQSLVDHLALVGHQIFLDEPDNIEDWATAARAILDAMRTGTGRAWGRGWSTYQVPAAIQGFRAAGRSPSYARAIIERAIAHGVEPDTFGYGDDITPAVFTALIECGIRTARHLEAYGEAGLDLPGAIAAAHDGLCAGAAAALHRDGISADQWKATAAGLPKPWFPLNTPDKFYGEDRDPVADGMLNAGFSWADLRFLADHQWERLRPDSRGGVQGLSLGRRRRTASITRDIAMAAAAVVPFEKLPLWITALTDGKPGEDGRGHNLPPLASQYEHGIVAFLPSIEALIGQGLSPSSLTAYRAAGCRSVDDVVAARRAGITPARARALTELVGARLRVHEPRRIPSLIALLTAHRDTPEG